MVGVPGCKHRVATPAKDRHAELEKRIPLRCLSVIVAVKLVEQVSYEISLVRSRPIECGCLLSPSVIPTALHTMLQAARWLREIARRSRHALEPAQHQDHKVHRLLIKGDIKAESMGREVKRALD
jgi:hypothetical protein